jgi:hypothetical protein
VQWATAARCLWVAAGKQDTSRLDVGLLPVLGVLDPFHKGRKSLYTRNGVLLYKWPLYSITDYACCQGIAVDKIED